MDATTKQKEGRKRRRGGTRVRPTNRQAILESLLAGETQLSAARRGGIKAERYYAELRADPAWREQVEAAITEGRRRRADRMASILYEGAERYRDDPRYTGGLIFALTNLDPARWRNTQHQRVEVQEQVEHDITDNLADVLRSIAGRPAAGSAEGPAGQRGNAAETAGGGPA